VSQLLSAYPIAPLRAFNLCFRVSCSKLSLSTHATLVLYLLIVIVIVIDHLFVEVRESEVAILEEHLIFCLRKG